MSPKTGEMPEAALMQIELVVPTAAQETAAVLVDQRTDWRSHFRQPRVLAVMEGVASWFQPAQAAQQDVLEANGYRVFV